MDCTCLKHYSLFCGFTVNLRRSSFLLRNYTLLGSFVPDSVNTVLVYTVYCLNKCTKIVILFSTKTDVTLKIYKKSKKKKKKKDINMSKAGH